MAEFLLEILSEDIPARMQERAAQDLARLITERLDSARIPHGTAHPFSGLRRIGVMVPDLPLRQPDILEERKGPRVGAPDAAVKGFLRAAGVESLDRCEKRDTGKGVFWFAIIERSGRAVDAVLAETTVEAILAMPWPKSMRWGEAALRWVRPIHSILAVFNGTPLPGGLGLGRLGTAGEGPRLITSPRPDENGDSSILWFSQVTYGHRFLAPGPLQIKDYEDYRRQLRGAYVLIERAERRARILDQVRALAAGDRLKLIEDADLLEEVTGLVEWPGALMGRIEDRFMELPPEVLTTSMRTHQKYFALQSSDGRLAARFVTVANMVPADAGRIVTGNERVLRARLSDARFFWDQDRKHPLRTHLGALRSIVFHTRLGTVFDKVTRLEGLSGELSSRIPGADEKLARHAAILSKTDLVTGMVGEFPELQGVMGRYYALAAGEPETVADALADHYRPQGPGERCPTQPIGVVLALADKIDTLVGFFSINEKPTGSRDPYALRRAALGVIRLVVENKLRLDLREICRFAHGLFLVEGLRMADETADDLLDFLTDRLKVVLRDQGVRHDLIDAVFALGREGDLVRLLDRVQALQQFLATEDGTNLLTAYRRATNIVRIEEKKDGRSYADAAAPTLLGQAEEKALFEALRVVGPQASELLRHESFAACMVEMARLRPIVDAFFDRVTVNVEDKATRANRLALLHEISATLNTAADFSRIEG